MDRAEVLRKVFEEERRVAVVWAGARGETDPAGAIRAVLHRERTVRHTSIKARVVLADTEMHDLFVSFCRRYGLEPYRAPRQRKSCLMLDGPERFVTELFVPLFNTCGDMVRRDRKAWFRAVLSEIDGGAVGSACGTCGAKVEDPGAKAAGRGVKTEARPGSKVAGPGA